MAEIDDLVAALSEPSFYPHHPAEVVHHQTHLSHVFVAEPFAYKLKKPVAFPFVDLGTRERRSRLCRDEVRLNRRLCPEIYLGVTAVERSASGALALARSTVDGDVVAAGSDARPGATVEDLVWMRSLPAHGMGRAALAAGRITPALLFAFARDLARFHAAAPIEPPDAPGANLEAIEKRWLAVLRDAEPMVGRLLAAEDRDVLLDFGPTFVRRHATALAARAAAGRVREVHGDLHLGNLCLIDTPLPALAGAPAVPAGLYAFDCIEFARDLRVNDVASEVAFLAMDLEAADRPDLSRAFVDAYVSATGDHDVAALLPFFASHRAAIRGMVLGLAAGEAELSPDERDRAVAGAKRHFALAVRDAWRAAGPALVACAGLSGSGKTTVATLLAEATGFAVVSSDDVRKRAAGLDPHAPAPPEAAARLYGRAARRATYEAIADRASAELAHGTPVIADATFNRAQDRALVARAARRAGCPHLFLECVVDDATAGERLRARAAEDCSADPHAPARSDADASVRALQARERDPFAPDEPHATVDTSGPRGAVRAAAVRALWRWRREHRVRALRQTGEP